MERILSHETCLQSLLSWRCRVYAARIVFRGSDGRALVQAWESRTAGAVARGLGHAVAGHNRRVVYSDGTAKMHGNTNDPQFRRIEGYEDHCAQILCYYNTQKRLKAAALTLATTAQAEGGSRVSADFWHDVRQAIRQRHGEDVCVLGFCAPAGDRTPLPQVGRKGEQRMQRLRGLTYCQAIGRRVAGAFEDVAAVIAQDIRADVPLVHRVQQVELPARIITESEYTTAKKVCEEIDVKRTRAKSDHWTRNLYRSVADRYFQSPGRSAGHQGVARIPSRYGLDPLRAGLCQRSHHQYMKRNGDLPCR